MPHDIFTKAYKTMEARASIVFLYVTGIARAAVNLFLCPGENGKEGKWIIKNLQTA